MRQHAHPSGVCATNECHVYTAASYIVCHVTPRCPSDSANLDAFVADGLIQFAMEDKNGHSKKKKI